jgi:hypothetical protein
MVAKCERGLVTGQVYYSAEVCEPHAVDILSSTSSPVECDSSAARVLFASVKFLRPLNEGLCTQSAIGQAQSKAKQSKAKQSRAEQIAADVAANETSTPTRRRRVIRREASWRNDQGASKEWDAATVANGVRFAFEVLRRTVSASSECVPIRLAICLCL